MATFTPIAFTANTKAKSADVNGNFTQIQTILNGGIVNANIDSAAAIARTKMAAGTVGHVGINDPTTGFLSDYGVATTVQAKWVPLSSQGSDPSTPPSGAVLLYNKNKKLYTINDSGAVTQVGAGSNSQINYVTNSDAEVDTTGWATYSSNVTATITIASPAVITVASTTGYAVGEPVVFTTTGALPTGLTSGTTYYISSVIDGTTFKVSATLGGSDVNTSGTQSGTHSVGLARPITGSGGTATATWTRSTSSPLRGTANFLFTAGKVGDGSAYAFTIDSADQAKVLNISFDYNLSGTITDGDYSVWIYDVTNGVRIQPAPYKISGLSSSLNGKYIGTFQTASNSTSYRLCVHQSATSSVNVKIDNVQVGPQIVEYGSPVTDWDTSWVPTGSWTANTTYTGWRRRVGDEAEFKVKILLSGAPTSASLTVTLPVTIDTAKLNSGSNTVLGWGSLLDSGTDLYQDVSVYYSSTTDVAIKYGIVSSASASAAQLNSRSVTQAAPITFASGDEINVTFRVPIAGWSSSVAMSNDTDTRVVALSVDSPSSSLGASQIDIAGFATPSIDTHGAFNATTGVYTVPVPGYYSVNCNTLLGASNFASNGNINLNLVKNGVEVRCSQTRTTNTMSAAGTAFYTVVRCVAGDTLKMQISTNGTSPVWANADSSPSSWLEIQRLSGPSQIAASETIAGTYKTLSSTTITSGTALQYTTKVSDKMLSYNTSTGEVTVPSPGTYMFQISGSYSAGAADIHIYVNGVDQGTFGFIGNADRKASSVMYPLIANDVVKLVPGQSITTTDTVGWFSFVRVGN